MNSSDSLEIAPLAASSAADLRGRRVLFISPTGAMSPLLWSQGIPHLRELRAKYGIDPVLLTIEAPVWAAEENREAEHLFSKLSAWGIEWHVVHGGTIPILPNSTVDLLKCVPVVLDLIRKKRVDIIHGRSYVPAFLMLLLGRLVHAPFVFDMRGFYPDEYVRYGYWTRKMWQYRASKWLERRCLKSADWIVVTSQGMHRELLRMAENCTNAELDRKTSIIPNCVDVSRFDMDPSIREIMRASYGLKDSVVLLWLIGGITKPHMPEEICSFFRVAKTILRSLRLVVLTHSPDVDDWLRRGGLLPEDYLTFNVAPREVPRFVAMADGGLNFCDPLQSGSAIKIAEYLAAGVPLVISSTVERARELTAEAMTGVIVGSFTRDAYVLAARQLGQLLEGDRVSLSRRCKKLAAERLSLDYAVGEYANVYRHVLRSSACPDPKEREI